MLQALLIVCVAAIVLYVIWMLISKMVPGTVSQIVGIIAAIILVIVALKAFGIHVGGL